MPAVKDNNNRTEDNHTILVQLSDGLQGVVKSFERFATEQQEENSKLHGRIDQANVSINSGLTSINDKLSSRGQISSSFIFGLIAILVSTITMIGGVGQAYVSVRLSNITPTLEAITARIALGEQERAGLKVNLHTGEVNAERNSAATARDLYWLDRIKANAPTH